MAPGNLLAPSPLGFLGRIPGLDEPDEGPRSLPFEGAVGRRGGLAPMLDLDAPEPGLERLGILAQVQPAPIEEDDVVRKALHLLYVVRRDKDRPIS
jgi:hypothetical protein